jgi:hypothetical protein
MTRGTTTGGKKHILSTFRDLHSWPTGVSDESEGVVSNISTPNSRSHNPWSEMYFVVFVGMVSQVQNADPETHFDEL